MTFDRPTLDRLYRYGYSLTAREDDARALLQRAAERYLRRESQPEYPIAYLRRTMRNLFIDDLRKSTRLVDVSYDADVETYAALGVRALDDVVIEAAEVEALWQALKPLERELLYLWAVEGLTAQEIADQTDTPRNTILSRIHRTKLRLAAWRDERETHGGTGT